MGKNLNIDSGRVHRSNPFVVESVDTGRYAQRWITGEPAQLFPRVIGLLNRIGFVGLRNCMCFVMLFKGDDLHDLMLLSKVRISELIVSRNVHALYRSMASATKERRRIA